MTLKTYKIILGIFLVISVAAGGVLGYYDARLEAAINKTGDLGSVDVGDVKFDEDVVNILLVGSDRRSDEEAAGRSDSSMIATINFKTKELKLTSIMRDIYVEIPGHGRDKLNSAYAYGGVELLYQTIAKNFGIKIDKYCVVDFDTFEKVINEVGGIEIDLEEKEAQYLNTTNYISKKKYRNVKAGKHTLNGNQALGYSRIRYVVSKKYGDGDFGRTGRQRAVMQATFDKVKGQSLTKILDIALKVLSDVSTDMDADYIKGLAASVIKMGTTDIDQMRIPIEGSYKMGRAQHNMFVFFINFNANKAAMNYFIFGDGKAGDGSDEAFAKEYDGLSGVETFGYSGVSNTSSGSTSSGNTGYNNSGGSAGSGYSTSSTSGTSRPASTSTKSRATTAATQATTEQQTQATTHATTAAKPENTSQGNAEE